MRVCLSRFSPAVLFLLAVPWIFSASMVWAQLKEPDAHSLNMPTGPAPVRGYEPYIGPLHTATQTVIGGVPAYLWRHGCGPTAAGMVIGFWDLTACPLLIPGDASTQTNAVDQAIATGNGAATHYSDYALPLDSSPNPIQPDLSGPPVGDEHASNCLGDFMRTSWSAAGNYYGWSWFSDVDNAVTGYVNWVNTTYEVAYITNTHGETWGDFTWADFQNEVNGGRPMVFLVDSDGSGGTDHFVTAIGWRDSNGYNEYACLDTWGTGIRWERFRQLQAGSPWGIYGALFVYITSDPAEPVATGVTPDEEYQGLTTTITVTGSNFLSGAYVEMGSDVSVNYTNFINSTTFDANITISNTATVGLRDVVVYNPNLKHSTIVNGFEVKRSTKHYASPTGGNVFPYITPANAATSLANAISATGAGDSLLVESATYTNVDLSLSQGVKMYGAWNSSFTTRNVASGKTVFQLNGNIKVGPGATGESVIDGFEIYSGTGTMQMTPIAGRYGGAIWATTSPLAVANCLIRNSQAHDGTYGAGGGIYASGCTIGITATEIRDCAAGQGGAIFLDTCTGSVVGNSIHDNDLLYSAQPANGGGVLVTGSSGFSFSGNTITANTADIAFSSSMAGGGVYLKNTTGVTMNGDIVSNNIVGMTGPLGYGGGIYVQNSGLTMTGVRIEGNQSKIIGGGIYTDATSTLSMGGGTVLNNSAMLAGGAYLSGPTSHVTHNLWTGNTGTACYFLSATTGSFIGNTMNLNSGAQAGALYLSNTAPPMIDNIITNSTGSGMKFAGAPLPTPTYCDVWNNTTNYDGCVPGTGCISLDPLYVNAGSGDYHLGVNSPAIDAGDPNPATNDPDGSRGDMGIYGAHAFVMDQPSYPKNLTASVVSLHTVLTWTTNPEPDVTQYAVYKDTSPTFIPSAANFVALVAAPDTTYDDGTPVSGTYYKVSAIDALAYAGGYAGPVEPTLTGIGEDVVSYAFRLEQNHPNPFNPTTRIRYEVGSREHVSLRVFDVRGQLVKELVNEVAEPGIFTKEWDGTNANGEQVSTGVYFYRLNAGAFAQTRKMILLK